MAIYNYIALKNNKDIVKGKVNAEDLREARESIRSLGFIPTKVYEEKTKGEEDNEKKTEVKCGKIKKLGFKKIGEKDNEPIYLLENSWNLKKH